MSMGRPYPENHYKPLDDFARALVEEHYNLVRLITWKNKHLYSSGWIDKDEIESTVAMALVTSASMWKDYCSEHGYNYLHTQYFKVYTSRHMQGAVLDLMRKRDPVTRADRKKIKDGLILTVPDKNMKTAISLEEYLYLEGSDNDFSSDIPDDSEPSHDSSQFVRQILDLIVATIREMPFQTQVILAMHYFEELDLQYIGPILGMTEHNVSLAHGAAVVEIQTALRDYVKD